MICKFPPEFTCGFGGITAPRLVCGSAEVQMLRNKTVLPIFFIPPPLPLLSKNRTKLATEIAFFSSTGCQCYTAAVVHFQVLGKVGLLWGEDFGKMFPLWTSEWSSGEQSHRSVNVLPLASTEAGWDPACKHLEVSDITGVVAWEMNALQCWGQLHNVLTIPTSPPYAVKIPYLFFCKIKFTCDTREMNNTTPDRDTVQEKAAWRDFSKRTKSAASLGQFWVQKWDRTKHRKQLWYLELKVRAF